MIELDLTKYPELMGKNELYSNEKDELSSLVMVNKDSGTMVYPTDFEEPLEESAVQEYQTLKVKALDLYKKEYESLYKEALDCTKGSFKICDDGKARLVVTRGEKVFLYESKVIP